MPNIYFNSTYTQVQKYDNIIDILKTDFKKWTTIGHFQSVLFYNTNYTRVWLLHDSNSPFLFLGYSNQEVQRTCQRCELETIASKGIFNLRVKDVRLGEDEHFECQVSPGKGAINSVPLRTPVKITIQGKI